MPSLEYSVEYYPNRLTPTNSFCYFCDVVMNIVIIIRVMIRFGDYDDNNNNNSNNRVKNESDTSNHRANWYYLRIIQKITKSNTGRAQNQGIRENSHVGHCTRTS